MLLKYKHTFTTTWIKLFGSAIKSTAFPDLGVYNVHLFKIVCWNRVLCCLVYIDKVFPGQCNETVLVHNKTSSICIS